MRLLKESDVIKAIDKHTKEDGTLNEDITVILEEVRTAFDREKVVKKLKRLETNSFGYYNQYDDEQAFGESAAYRVAIEIVEKGEIDYPENRWIPSDCPIKPKDKELCTIILKAMMIPSVSCNIETAFSITFEIFFGTIAYLNTLK